MDMNKENTLTTAPSKPNYVAVYSYGGIIDAPIFGSDLQALVANMRSTLERIGFDKAADDARIFKRYGSCSIEVYSYNEFSYLLFNNEVEVLNQAEDKVMSITRNELTEDMIIVFDPADHT